MKKTILITLFTLVSASVFSQVSFSHSLGASIYVNSITAGGAVVYSPRLNVLNFDDEGSVSLGTHLGLGFSGSVNSQTGGSGSLTFDAPIVVEYNGALACTPDASSQGIGYFFGGGFGYNLMGGSDAFGGYGGSSAGPIINAGIHGFVFEKLLGVRLAYLINVKSYGASTFGIGVYYMLGDYY